MNKIRFKINGEKVTKKEYMKFVYELPPEYRRKFIKCRIVKHPTPYDKNMIIEVSVEYPYADNILKNLKKR